MWLYIGKISEPIVLWFGLSLKGQWQPSKGQGDHLKGYNLTNSLHRPFKFGVRVYLGKPFESIVWWPQPSTIRPMVEI